MENSFRSIIDQSKSILILVPTNPYFDQVAAGMAIYLALRQSKDVQVYSPTPTTVELNRIIGVNRITQDLGNKNLIIRFSDYKADDIERVSYDIENGQFRLTVIPRQKISPPVKEQVELSYSGISSDTIIMVGGTNESHFPAISSKELVNANIVHVGTKDLSLSSNKAYISFSKPASSVSEVVADLLKESSFNIDEDIATNLIMGIENASNNLTDSGVTANTFSVISELMKFGGKRAATQPMAKRSDFPQGAIPGQLPPRQVANQSTDPGRYASNQSLGKMSQMTKAQQQMLGQQRAQQQLSKQQNLQQTTNKDLQNKKDQEDGKEANDETQKNPPKDWLQPKIYKGTSIS
jgi:hypothetical protein